MSKKDKKDKNENFQCPNMPENDKNKNKNGTIDQKFDILNY